MISWAFNIMNPWSTRFRSLATWSGSTPLAHKFWELEIIADHCVITAELFLRHRVDHAGLRLALGLFGYAVHLEIYDNRHWDYKQGCWETYNNE